MKTLTIQKPDDWHCHFRDGDMLKAVVPHTAKRFGRAIIMPNLAPSPVTTTEALLAYRDRVCEATKEYPGFTPLMTYYLTNRSNGEEIAKGYTDGIAHAVKLYPAGATTNSNQGVTDMQNVYPIFEKMQEVGMPLLVHGETVLKNGTEVAPEDREKVFLDRTLPDLLKNFPELKIVLEHATTKDAVDFVRREASPRLASTITLHHLMVNKGDMAYSDKPAYYHCLPIIKAPADQRALREAATSGEPFFFLGTDSAPHPVSKKESDAPPGGVFTAPSALELYAQVFDEENALDNFEAFASLNGPRFYGLEPNTETITLKRELWTIENMVLVENGDVVRPFGYHEEPQKRLSINWKVAE